MAMEATKKFFREYWLILLTIITPLGQIIVIL